MQASFPASLEALPSILHWVRNLLMDANMDPRVAKRIELAVEEAIVNVIHHAHQKTVELKVSVLPQAVHIDIIDQGPPFNPLEEVSSPNRCSPLTDREVGGLGVFLMRSLVDEIQYRREGKANILTLIKLRGSAP